MFDLCMTPGLILHTAYSSNKNKTQTQTKPAEFRAHTSQLSFVFLKKVLPVLLFFEKKNVFPHAENFTVHVLLVLWRFR